MEENHRLSIDNIWKVLLTLVLIVIAAIASKEILLPIIFSFFLATLLNPIVDFFREKCGINKIISIFFTLILVIGVIGGIIYYISSQAKGLILDLPNLIQKLKFYIEDFGLVLDWFGNSTKSDLIELLKKNADKILSSGGNLLSNALSYTSNFLTFFSLIPIYIFFMLYYKENFKRFIRAVDRSEDNNLGSMFEKIKDMVHNYIVGLGIVITIIAILNSTGLAILGIRYALFLGVLSAILTVIPYIGIFIGGLIPFLVALLTKDSFFYPLAVVGLMALVQFLEGNFITPNIIGSKVNINPLAAIIALVIGGKVWGILGMIMAIPICGITKIFLENYDRLKPYAILLESHHGEKPPSSFSWKKLKTGIVNSFGKLKIWRKER